MDNDGVNRGRRRMLTGAVGVVGGVGAIFAAVPFIRMWAPSARAQAAGAPVQADISKIEPGQRLQFEWRGKPIWVIQRTPEMLSGLSQRNDRLRDPDSADEEQQPAYAQNEHRSIEPDIMVVVAICTHLGCVPRFIPELTPQPFDPEWSGGFYCPCHNSKFDLAGRVYSGVPAPANLQVPPHSLPRAGELIIGVDGQGSAA